MKLVWLAFEFTAVLLALAAWAMWGYRRKRRAEVRGIIAPLLILAAVTAVFPALLPLVGVEVWVAGYIALVVVLTGFITTKQVLRT